MAIEARIVNRGLANILAFFSDPDGLAPRPKTRALEKLNWDRLIRAASRQYTLAIVQHNITENPIGITVPSSVLREIESRLARFQLKTAFHRDALVEALSEFSRRRQKVVVLKGPALAERYYPEPWLRLFSDIDLMVPRSVIPEVQDTLHYLGYEPQDPDKERLCLEEYGELTLTRRYDPVPIKLELHWDFVNSRSLRSVAGVRARDFWGRAAPTSILGVPAFELAPEDSVFGLVLHLAYNHQFHRLLSLVDICQILRRCGDEFDWDRLVNLAQKRNLKLAFSTTFRLAHGLFGLSIPGEVRPYFAPTRLYSKVAEHLLGKQLLGSPSRPRGSLRRKLYREVLKREGR